MNLHDQAVFQAHTRHLGEHLRAKQLLLRSVGVTGKNTNKEFCGLGGVRLAV
jgi:hypothetical protein